MDLAKETTWNVGLLDRGYTDLQPVTCGYEACLAGHTAYGLREYYLIHYVERGRGVLYTESGAHPVRAGQIFLIKRRENARYVADAGDPWSYVWIGFVGRLAEKLDTLSPVSDFSPSAFSAIRALAMRADTREEMATACLFAIYADLMSGRSSRPHYVRRTAETIRTLYMTPLTVEGLAAAVGLDRRYLARIFKASMGKSIQEYLIEVRMEQARSLLRQKYPVSLTSELVGYTDPFHFSKMFKRRYGISPKKFALG